MQVTKHILEWFSLLNKCGGICTPTNIQSESSTLKAMSIPRLELSAQLLALLMSSVRAAFENQLELSPKLWLDSMTALNWIQNRGEWKQFVQHRVSEILKLKNKIDSGCCLGIENPADVGARGELASQLKDEVGGT